LARIELSAEVKTIESLIDAKEQAVASTRLQAAHANIGRRPEYRYLVCLYDSTFRVRADRELLRDVIELVGEQPDLMEATALLAELYARTGDEARADLFARLALESASSSARGRAFEVLKAQANDGTDPPTSHIHETGGRVLPTGAGRPVSGVGGPGTELDLWFERVRRDLVHRRSPTYGVRSMQSIVEMLLDWGKAVAEGTTFISERPLPLTRSSLVQVDEAILSFRRQPGSRQLSKSDTSHTMAAAGFFLAVVINELNANVLEIAPDDGGCKVLLPSGAGARPLLAAAAFAQGTGPTLVQTFDRLAAAQELASAPPASDRLSRHHSSERMPVAPRVPSSIPSPASGIAVSHDELALTRPEAEAVPLRVLARPSRTADPPPLDLARIASALATSPLSQDIAAASSGFLAATPSSVEALESYCLATRGQTGAAPNDPFWHPSDDDEELILAWGALLGETLIAAYGGIWECDPNAPSDPRLFRVICEDRVAAWPITQVYLRLKNGMRHNLLEFVASVGRLLRRG